VVRSLFSHCSLGSPCSFLKVSKDLGPLCFYIHGGKKTAGD
jgi:hypothetical protein